MKVGEQESERDRGYTTNASLVEGESYCNGARLIDIAFTLISETDQRICSKHSPTF